MISLLCLRQENLSSSHKNQICLLPFRILVETFVGDIHNLIGDKIKIKRTHAKGLSSSVNNTANRLQLPTSI